MASSLPQELVIITWHTQNRAAKVLQALQTLDATHAVDLKYAQTIVKDTHGNVVAQTPVAPVTPGEGAIAGAITGGLISLVIQHFTHQGKNDAGLLHDANDIATTVGVAAGSGAGLAAVSAFGQVVPKSIVQEVERNLIPKSSALVAVIHIDDIARVLETLQAFPDGTIVQTTLPKDLVARLAKVEHTS